MTRRKSRGNTMASTNCLGKTADIIENLLLRCNRREVHRSYDDKNGEKRYVTEVVVTEVLLLESSLK
jgi:single-stranded DNA-binding protein